MSQYKITKKRLAEIIKEEYRALNEDNALTRTIGRWAEEAREIPAHLTVARMIESGDLDGAIETLEAMRTAQVAIATNRTGEPTTVGSPDVHVEEGAKPDFLDLDDDGDKEESMEKAEKDKKINKESLDSIRDLIQQELQNL